MVAGVLGGHLKIKNRSKGPVLIGLEEIVHRQV